MNGRVIEKLRVVSLAFINIEIILVMRANCLKKNTLLYLLTQRLIQKYFKLQF